MPKIIVISESIGSEGTITLEERVVAAHLEDGHSAAQLVERLGWAIVDAEDAEGGSLDGQLSTPRPVPGVLSREWASPSHSVAA